ncbi:MurR/RpiR family transcriptional regulator [Dysosmobacter sp. HCP28S3_G4]|uniref:MurR/RpiR family transcriptional regulator n=1 Tax=Dysosmobacter sp. HCP28S3_G4 TaxID=3438938 RepID=UPI003F8A1DA5
MPEENVFTRITREYYQLTASEKKLAAFVTANGQRSQTMSISELAAACGVAEATISRFCRRMGYRGYSAFRLAIAAATAGRSSSDPLHGEILPEDTVPDLCAKLAGVDTDAIRETQSLIIPDSIIAAANILTAADKVLCMGQGGSMLMAEEAAHLFTTAFPGFFAVADSHMQVITASSLTERDAILFFSYSGSTKDLMDVLHVARQQHAKSILVTRYPGSPGAALVDVVLQCGSIEGPLQLGSVAARIAQLYLIDVLFSEMCRRDMERCRHQRELVAEALSEKHV